MNIGTSIKKIRKSKRYSQSYFAEKVGISITSLSLIETNKSIPKKSTYNKMLEVLNVNNSYVLFLALEIENISEDKKVMFNVLYNGLKTIIEESVQNKLK